MITYNPNAIYSFTDKLPIRKEITMTRVYKRRGKKIVETFYAEHTDVYNMLVIPDSLVKDCKSNSPNGFVGTIKEGDYFMGKERVILDNAHQVYNGRAYVTVEEI